MDIEFSVMKTLFSLAKTPFIGMVLWASVGNVFASPASLNAGVSYCDATSNPLPAAARDYALTGRAWSGFKPAHSRAWYATALGLSGTLEQLIAKNPKLVKNKRLLSLAAASDNSDSLTVFLAHGANPNAVINGAGSTMLEAATACEHQVNMVELLNAGASLYKEDTAGGNAMFFAASGGAGDQLFYSRGVMLLLAAGYDPLCYAGSASHLTVSDMLTVLLSNAEKETGSKKWPALRRNWLENLRNLVHVVRNVVAIQKSLGHKARDCS